MIMLLFELPHTLLYWKLRWEAGARCHNAVIMRNLALKVEGGRTPLAPYMEDKLLEFVILKKTTKKRVQLSIFHVLICISLNIVLLG